MHRFVKVGLIVGGVTLAAVAQSAYTTSISSISATKVLGFASTSITGATATDVRYTYSTDNSQIASIAVDLSGDTTASHLYVGYNALAPTDCGSGTYDGSTTTTYSCTSLNWTVSGITAINFIVR